MAQTPLPPLGAEVVPELPPIGGEVVAAAPADTPAPAPESAVARYGAGLWKTVNPIAAVSGLYGAVKSPEAVGQTIEGIYDAAIAQFGKAKEAYTKGDYEQAAAYTAAGLLPVLGPATTAAGERMRAGDVAGGLGEATGIVGGIVGPSAAQAVRGTALARAVTTPVAEVIGRQAVPLVRAGVKPALTTLKQQAGASTVGVSAVANRLARFIIDNRITTPGKATQIIKNAEAELQQILATKGSVPTDAPTRAQLYLDILEQKAAKSLSPDHAATIRAAAAGMVEGPLGMTVPVPTTSGPQFTRTLRPDVPAAEALDIARTTSRFETRRSWGEQKGTATEAIKAQERAVRDAFKDALPEARTPLEQQGQAILAQKVMDRQVWREANRDVLSLPGLVGFSANAVVGFAAHWLRNNQLRAGIWADQLSKAIAGNNAAAAAGILSRLNVRLPQLGVLLEQQRLAAPAAVPTGAQAETP